MLQEFSYEDLIACYRRGVFPMADSRHDRRIFLVEPIRRGILPLDGLRISRRLARTVRSDRYQISVNRDFPAVIKACAASYPGRPETWINQTIERLCLELHATGDAHSVEAWLDGQLVGGLYGIALGGAFFGESMFSTARDASKVALVHLVARLRAGGFELLDTQFVTNHLTSLGAIELDKSGYRARLAKALDCKADFLAPPSQLTGCVAIQLTSQAS